MASGDNAGKDDGWKWLGLAIRVSLVSISAATRQTLTAMMMLVVGGNAMGKQQWHIVNEKHR